MAIGTLISIAGKALAKKAGKESSKEVAKKGTEIIGRRPNRDMGMVEDVTPKRLTSPAEETAKRGGKGAALAAAGAAGAAAGIGYAATRGKKAEDEAADSKRPESGKGRSFQDERPVRQAGLMSVAKEEAKSADKVSSTFSAAFKEARSSGDKTFTFQGKKYTTELASEKKAPKISDESVEEMRKENLSRMNDTLAKTKPIGVREGRNENIDEDTRKRAMSSVANMNKGGSVSAYAKGGMIKANCGASVPPTQKKK